MHCTERNEEVEMKVPKKIHRHFCPPIQAQAAGLRDTKHLYLRTKREIRMEWIDRVRAFA